MLSSYGKIAWRRLLKDKFHRNAQRLFLVFKNQPAGGEIRTKPFSPEPIAAGSTLLDLFGFETATVNASPKQAQPALEVGVRKTMGAASGSLIIQFLGESMTLALAAFIRALGLSAIPPFIFLRLTRSGCSRGGFRWRPDYQARCW